jgi:sodium-dependent dicarboxylate transporter 2/3/5
MKQKMGLLLGLGLFLAVLMFPIQEITPTQQKTLAVAVLMGTWWVSSAFPVAVTALLPLALFPILSVLPMDKVAGQYSSSIIFLFMGGFMMSQAIHKWGLHHRIALNILHFVGGGPKRIIGGFLLATAFLSMWISNTSAAIMVFPMALAVIEEIQGRYDPREERSFGLALCLAVAYAASIGGVATLIGTPPNLVLIGQMEKLLPDVPEITFLQWMLFGVPCAVGLLFFLWIYLSYWILQFHKGITFDYRMISLQIGHLGAMNRSQKGVLWILFAAIICWITRADLDLGSITIYGWETLLHLPDVDDGTVAIFFTLMMFLFPVDWREGKFLLEWEDAKKIPWEIILLFGGGFALGYAFTHTGLSDWFGQYFLGLQGVSSWIQILTICLAVTFFSEIASNTATATLMIPILISVAQSLEISPMFLIIPATIAASFGFMLPVATPPNAIVFASGRVTVQEMAKAGFFLNVIGSIWVTFIIHMLGPYVFNF